MKKSKLFKVGQVEVSHDKQETKKHPPPLFFWNIVNMQDNTKQWYLPQDWILQKKAKFLVFGVNKSFRRQSILASMKCGLFVYMRESLHQRVKTIYYNSYSPSHPWLNIVDRYSMSDSWSSSKYVITMRISK